MNQIKVQGFLALLFLILITFLSSLQLRTPEPVLPGYATDSYSAYRAIDHLKWIAKEPHAGGTIAHKKVRNYIYDFCKSQNLETKVFNHTGLREYGKTAVAGNAFNILAKIKGNQSTRAVLVMAHYDSQPNTPGAADDGSGVASMLEVIELLSKQEGLKNDIYFLFTDLEEVGLLGAEAFVHNNKELQETGIILNFEARGNAGVNFTFETSNNNGWLIKEFSKAVEKPLANSLAYEIYKLMPNDSDFSMFRDVDISGLNTAFIDGYVNYHSPQDTHQNIDMGSLQHQGNIMWQMVNHFGNTDLSETKSDDAIFFSVYNYLIVYPLAFNTPLVVITILALIIAVYFGFRKSKISGLNLFKSIAGYLLFILVSMVIAWLLNTLVLYLNPHYSNFYSNNFYNGPIYLWMFIGSTVLIYHLVNTKITHKLSTFESLLGALVMQTIFCIALRFIVPTGPYILYVPLLVTFTLIFIELINSNNTKIINGYLLPILPTLLFLPFIYILFIVFSLSLPYASIFFIALLLPYFLSLIQKVNKIHKQFLSFLAGVLCLGSLLVGQFSSKYSSEKPLQSFLTYSVNEDSKEAFWVSNQKVKDDFINKYIPSEKKENLTEIFPNSTRLYWKEQAAMMDSKSAKVKVKSDTIITGKRSIHLEIIPQEESNYFYLILPKGTIISKVNERKTNGSTDYLVLYGAGRSVTDLELISTNNQSISLTLIESQLEINKKLLTHPWPDNHIPGTGRLSNNILVKKTIEL